jgi:glycosyltransferase involved in cell wall biosynthesis
VPSEDQPSIGILFEQFAAYHVDRCEAAAARLQGRFRTLAVEVATSSTVYAWEASGGVTGAEKATLFPGRRFEEVGWFARLRAEFAALRQCALVFVGIAYSRPDVIVLSWLLRLAGTRVIVMTESKHDDQPRHAAAEWIKRQLLRAYYGAVVGARRQAEYMHSLGFAGRPVVPGYDAVSVERVREQARTVAPVAWEDRPFIYVGRFVAKKNLARLLAAYARYVEQAGSSPRPLVLVGDGELRAGLERVAADLGIAARVQWRGFLGADAVSRALAASLALCLVSTEEQWGLVVNEAVSLGLPAIVSTPVGARDALVRAGRNGYVVEPDDIEGIAQAMFELGNDRARWDRMAAHSAERAWLGDSERFADAVELLAAPPAPEAVERIARFEREVGLG